MARRKGRTRKSLMEAAITLVLKKGYDDVVTDEIAEQADVGRRTFYNHFVNKRNCVSEAVAERYGDFATSVSEDLGTRIALRSGDTDDAAYVIATMALRMFRLISGDPITERLVLYPRILHEAVSGSQRAFIRANIVDGLEKGRFHSLLPAESLEPIRSWGFVGLVITAIERGSQNADSVTWAKFVLLSLGLDDRDADKVVKQVVERVPYSD
jgi:AcrR family transcriptional regulator